MAVLLQKIGKGLERRFVEGLSIFYDSFYFILVNEFFFFNINNFHKHILSFNYLMNFCE
jgi:hypothetical protein